MMQKHRPKLAKKIFYYSIMEKNSGEVLHVARAACHGSNTAGGGGWGRWRPSGVEVDEGTVVCSRGGARCGYGRGHGAAEATRGRSATAACGWGAAAAAAARGRGAAETTLGRARGDSSPTMNPSGGRWRRR
jgi:hypothetical protein